MFNWKPFKESILNLVSENKIGLEFFLIPLIILLYVAVAIFIIRRQKRGRWLLQLSSLVLFGFIYMQCLCLTKSLVLGGKDLLNSKFLTALVNFWLPLLTFGFVLFLGRYFFCFNVCPIGFLQELTGKAKLYKKKKAGLIFLALVLLVFGFLVWIYRPVIVLMGAGAWLGLLLLIITIVVLIYPKTSVHLRSVKYVILLGWVALLAFTHDKVPGPWCVVGQSNLAYSAIIPFAIVLLVSLVLPRAWCRYICPDGALLQLLNRRFFKELRRKL